MNDTNQKPRLFLSHSSADKGYATRLAHALRLAIATGPVADWERA